jgi:N-methylhydantoinase B
VTLVTKPGTVCDPVYPQTNGAQGMTCGTQIGECVQLVMSQVVPKETCASFSRHISPIVTGKLREVIDPRTGGYKNYRMVAFTSDGGSGAMWGYDGWESVGPLINCGGAVRTPLEIAERDAPYRYLVCEWIPDSSGDGEYRGCCGTHVQLLNEHDPKFCIVGDAYLQTGNSDGEKSDNFGILGGGDAMANQGWIRRGNRLTVLRMEDNVPMQPGDLMETKSGGGGGVGNPLNRDIEKVQWDVLNRYVSVKKAKDVYGVVVDPKTLGVKPEASKQLREKMKAGNKNKKK